MGRQPDTLPPPMGRHLPGVGVSAEPSPCRRGFAGTGGASGMVGLARLAVAATLLLTLAGLVVPVTASADGDRYQLVMALDGDCIGVNAPPRSKGLLTLHAPDGTLRARLRYHTRA